MDSIDEIMELEDCVIEETLAKFLKKNGETSGQTFSDEYIKQTVTGSGDEYLIASENCAKYEAMTRRRLMKKRF